MCDCIHNLVQVDQLKHKASILGKPIDAEDIAYLTVL